MHEPVTLMHPDARDPTGRGISPGFPADLLNQSARVVYHLGTEVRRARELGSYRLEEKLG